MHRKRRRSRDRDRRRRVPAPHSGKGKVKGTDRRGGMAIAEPNRELEVTVVTELEREVG